MSSRSMSRICGGGELKVCYMVKTESIGDNTSNNWGTHVHCDLLFQPSICEPTLLLHLATTKEVQLGNMAILQFYQGHDAGTCLQFLFVPLWLLSVGLTKGKTQISIFRACCC